MLVGDFGAQKGSAVETMDQWTSEYKILLRLKRHGDDPSMSYAYPYFSNLIIFAFPVLFA